MKDLRPIRGRRYIHELILEGEHEHQDFKFAISDARKIARSISAFANNDGGRLLIGVKDSGAIAGLRTEEDIYVVEQAAEMYCRPAQPLEVTPFACGDGLVVVRVTIAKSDRRPVMVDEGEGRERAYYRVADENIAVTDLMLRAWEAAAEGGTALLLTDRHRLLIGLLEREPGGLHPDAFALRAHLSQATARDVIIELYRLGLIDFRYNHEDSSFHLVNLPQ